MFSDFLRRIAIYFVGKRSFDCSVEEDSNYLGKYIFPKTDETRSFYQYKAQMHLKKPFARFFLNVASIPMLIAYCFKFSKKPEVEKKDAVFVMEGGVSPNILPDSLKSEFPLLEYYRGDSRRLCASDRRFLFKLYLKHPFSPHYVLKVTYKIAKYRFIIDKYEPKALIVHNEFSFTSSVSTVYCNKKGIELFNVMHGEKLFYIRDSFFKFNRCYIWSEFYKDLFAELRADPDQFIVEIPPSLKFASVEAEKTVDYTYYLQMQKGEELAKIVETLSAISKRGDKVAVRPHPRYTNLDELKALINDVPIEIESCREITVENSILRTKNVISLYSTVLLQAYINGVNIVIDDISNKDDYLKLVELKYVMLNAEHKLLSNIE